MALNQPYADSYYIDELIEAEIFELINNLQREGLEVEHEDVHYQFISREEFIWINSETIYPGEELPGRFGVYRGYAGGGIHSGLRSTEVYKMRANRQGKAERILGYFEDTFWSILKGIDQASQDSTGEELPEWERLTL